MPLAPKRLSILLAAAALLCAPAAQALILYGTGPEDVDNTLNTTDPDLPNPSSPWKYGVRFGYLNASGIYVGNGCVLTANHVDVVDGSIVINGAYYTRDLTFTPVQVSEGSDVVDLKLVKIVGNPTLPALPTLPINYSDTADLSLACTLVGSGVGKGAVITNQGWYWGGSSTALQRWGTNKTTSTSTTTSYQAGPTDPPTNYSYRSLKTKFNRALGSDTAQITFRDSGSGLFQQIDGVWKLSGICTSTMAAIDSAAVYDGAAPFYSSSPVLPDSPDSSVFVRLEKYAALLRYENWAAAKLGSPTASLTADPDKDGLSNLLEYAFHTDPNVAAVTALPQPGVESGYVTLTYTQLLTATDLAYKVEESPDLSAGSWVPATVTEEVVSASGVTRIVKAKVALGPATRKYLRLSVTRLP